MALSKLALLLSTLGACTARRVEYTTYIGSDSCDSGLAFEYVFDSGAYTYCLNVDVKNGDDYSVDVDCTDDEIKVRYYSEWSCEGDVTELSYALDTCLETPSNIGNTSEIWKCDEDDPCFARETTYACRAVGADVSAEAAFNSCFRERDTTSAELVLMSALRAGDLVVSQHAGKPAITRVIVNQHIHVERSSTLMHLHHAHGVLSLTADHVLSLDGKFVPARLATPGAMLTGAYGANVKVERVSFSRGGIINPITADGKILASTADGLPVLASTGNEWLADVMLSAYPQSTLSYNLAYAFPQSVQAFYDALLEPFFTATVPYLASAKLYAPAPVVAASLLLGDVLLAMGLAVYSLTLEVSLVLASAALVAHARRANTKA